MKPQPKFWFSREFECHISVRNNPKRPAAISLECKSVKLRPWRHCRPVPVWFCVYLKFVSVHLSLTGRSKEPDIQVSHCTIKRGAPVT